MSDLAGSLWRFYLYGEAAALRGEPLDACPYLIDYDGPWLRTGDGPCATLLRRPLAASRHRRVERHDAWVRGWRVGEAERLRAERRQMPHPPAGRVGE